MSDHTQGLWRWADYSLYNGDDTDIAIIGPDDGERIVQCVNSMAGIDDPEGFLLLAETLARYVQHKGHHDTCSHALVPDTQCNCGYEQALALFPKDQS